MKTTSLTAFAVLSAISTFGQFAIKVYQNSDIFSITYNEAGADPVTVDKFHFTRFTVAAGFQTKKGVNHEFELFIPEISRPLDDVLYPMDYELRKGDSFESEVSSYSLRYELNKTLTDESKPLTFNLGTGINPYYLHIEYFPNVETSYYSSSKLYGFALNLIPRICYKLSDRFEIDLNIPFKIYDLRWQKDHFDNPSIPIRQQTNEKVENVFFESAYTIRVGLAYRFAG